MRLTHQRFQLLRPRAQLLYTLLDGLYLAKRWEEKAAIKLYYLPDEGRGFFAEVGIDDGREQTVVRRSFTSSGPLEEYAYDVQLPEL